MNLDTLVDPALLLRGGVFLGIVGLLALWETLAPRRPLRQPRGERWLKNLGLAGLNGLAQALLLPVLPVGVAAFMEQRGWGLLNWVPLPTGLEIVAVVLVLDLAVYAQHVAFHRVPLLKRFHRVHHTDLDLDMTSGVRFHFGEGVLSGAFKMAVVAAMGASPAGVLAFELVLTITALFSHSNATLPRAVDRVLRRLLVTPNMHRVHHSVIEAERLSNFGFSLPWWDYAFGTYHAQPLEGHEGMTIGLPAYQDPRWNQFLVMLLMPFLSPERLKAPEGAPGVPRR